MMTKYVKTKDYEASQFDDEWVILNTDQFTATKVNEVGGFCWGLLECVQTVDSIAEEVKHHFKIVEDIESFKLEIEEFLTELHHYGLVTHVS
ncbi:PqqD family protein [Rossellomorea arthrocnemi]